MPEPKNLSEYSGFSNDISFHMIYPVTLFYCFRRYSNFWAFWMVWESNCFFTDSQDCFLTGYKEEGLCLDRVCACISHFFCDNYVLFSGYDVGSSVPILGVRKNQVYSHQDLKTKHTALVLPESPEFLPEI